MNREELINKAAEDFEASIITKERLNELEQMSDDDQKDYLAKCGTIVHPTSFEPYLKHTETGEIIGPMRTNVNNKG